MKAFTIEVTSCRNCPYSETTPHIKSCQKKLAAGTAGLGTRIMIYDQNEFEITPSCPMYNQATEQ